MDPIVLPAIGLGAFAVIAGARWFLAREQRLKRRIKTLPISSIADTPEQQDVRVTGRLAYRGDRAPLEAPLSGRPCAAWRVVVRERRGSGKNKRWITILEESDSRDFVLEDESGRAIVDGTLVELAVDFDRKGGTSFFSGPSPYLEEFLHERGIATKGVVFGKTLDYREGALEAGEQVTVAGSGVWENDPTQRGKGYRDVGKLLRVSAMSDGNLLATDDPKLAR
ncbi:MAG: hypothetical protein JJ863_22715 [Deltaproteobacteria bacterium]|nr:hypothetical protein [Deltaproteobacteria bacterium]